MPKLSGRLQEVQGRLSLIDERRQSGVPSQRILLRGVCSLADVEKATYDHIQSRGAQTWQKDHLWLVVSMGEPKSNRKIGRNVADRLSAANSKAVVCSGGLVLFRKANTSLLQAVPKAFSSRSISAAALVTNPQLTGVDCFFMAKKTAHPNRRSARTKPLASTFLPIFGTPESSRF